MTVPAEAPSGERASSLASAPAAFLDALDVSPGLVDDLGLTGASTLTPSGVPFEASVTGAGEAVRLVIDVGTDLPSFATRLARQREALLRLTEFLPTPAGVIAREQLCSLVDVLFPRPSEIGDSVRFGIWLGVVPESGDSPQLSVLKLYGNVRAYPGSLARLVDRSPAFAGLASAATSDRLEPMAVALQVDATGFVTHRLYVSPCAGAEHQVIEDLAPQCGRDAGDLLQQVTDLGLASLLWGPWVVLRLQPSSSSPAALALQLSTAPLYARHVDVDALARTLCDRLLGPTRSLDRALAAAGATGVPWRFTWFGLSFPPLGGAGKLTLYLSPHDR